jgi:hypothetical protein
MTTENRTGTIEIEVPDGFVKIINDFTKDILITFPEYTNIVQKWWNINEKLIEQSTAEKNIFKHCLKHYPERFFDILNKNDEIFEDSSDVNTEFLPGVVFKYLWKCDITDNTRETIWKYLQLILFSIIGTVNNPSEMGDMSKIFEDMDESELRNKLSETIENMKTAFSGDETNSTPAPPQSAEDIHNHLNDLMKGKLGKLAMEFAEETAHDLNIDMENTDTAKDAFQKLFSNPGNLMNVVKNVGAKLDNKIKSGELNETEIITEGMEILQKMKNVPGMENIQNMFSQMGMGKNAKMNMGAMENMMKQNLKMSQMKERMKKKAESKQQFDNVGKATTAPQTSLTDEQLASLFSDNVNRRNNEQSTKQAKEKTATNENVKKEKKKSKK